MIVSRSLFGIWFERIITLLVAVLLAQSLFFKFTNAPETQHIFGIIDSWAASFAISGLFNPGGVFSAKVVGTFELIASILLFVSLFFNNKKLRVLGALLTAQVIAGAIFFHLFTPLGTVVLDDGGLLFVMACLVFLLSLVIIWLNKGTLLLLRRYIPLF